jgi:hypothetical protein
MNGIQLTTKVIARIEKGKGKAFNLISAGKSGHADVIACLKGRHMELEIKGDNDDPSPLQIIQLNECIKAGGVGAVIYSMVDLESAIYYVKHNKPCPLIPTLTLKRQL